MAMIARVKPIFRRRSGVRKTRAMALNKDSSSDAADEGHRLPGYATGAGDASGPCRELLDEPPAATIFCSAEPETLSTTRSA
jgi:hypothetical protein